MDLLTITNARIINGVKSKQATKFMINKLATLFFTAFFLSCTHLPPSPQVRLENAKELAVSAKWQLQILHTDLFPLVSFIPKKSFQKELDGTHTPTQTLTIYIEGDGFAWQSSSRISLDPTPIRALGLELALKHPGNNVAYLARPCQFQAGLLHSNCEKKYWTSGRFSSAVIDSTQQAIDQLKQQFGAKELQLIGYSGGGAIAALVTAERSDVISLITVAGNLDHSAWTKHHRISALNYSLNPVDFWTSLQNTPQVHLVGGQDDIIGANISASFSASFPEGKKPYVKILDGFNHSCCWVENWPQLLENK